MARPRKLNESLEGFKELINHHIPYEVRMMRSTFAILADGLTCRWFSQVVINALIESFCLHARSLIEFFSNQKSPSKDMGAAKHFANPGYEPCSDQGPGKSIIHKLNAQIAHPSYHRTSRETEKLSAADRATLMKFLEGEISRFSAAMKGTYKPHWPTDMNNRQPSENGNAVINASGPAGPSTQIGTIGPVQSTGPAGPTGSVGPETFVYSTDSKRS